MTDECSSVKKCCTDCEAENGDIQHDESSCCLEVKKLPDSNLPSAPDRVPAFYAVELPMEAFITLLPATEAGAGKLDLNHAEHLALPPPSVRRAILGVWTV